MLEDSGEILIKSNKSHRLYLKNLAEPGDGGQSFAFKLLPVSSRLTDMITVGGICLEIKYFFSFLTTPLILA